MENTVCFTCVHTNAACTLQLRV